jgi:ABC-type phosphate transport system substrate-binding protein
MFTNRKPLVRRNQLDSICSQMARMSKPSREVRSEVMMSRMGKVPRRRAVALAVGVGVLSSFAFTGTSLANPPASGTACQASDGKISGRGATFQTKAQQALIAGYTSDVCGPVTSDADAGTNMLVYNYSAAASAGATGSGAGQKAASCRTDAFSGTDVPYDQATLTSLNGAPGGLGGCAITFVPPFSPNSPAVWPDPTDATAKVMSFPVAGSSVGIGVNLSAANCGGTAPGSINLSTANMSKLISGDITAWNDSALVADNPALANCTQAVTRVVRLDKSGTTQTFKNYLKNADGGRTLCDGTTWTTLATDANNVNWPTTAPCPANLARPATSGGAAVVSLVSTTDGAFGYADYADWISKGIPLAKVSNAAGAFQSPGTGNSASCGFSGAVLPGTSIGDAVGTNTTLNWATDASPNRSDVTYQGSGYPICGFTWDFVYTKLNSGAVANPIARLTADQRRTLYSYFTYVFSPAAQSRLTNAGYDQLPAGWLTKLRQGFQANF